MKFWVTGAQTSPGRQILERLTREGVDAVGVGLGWAPGSPIQDELDAARPDFIINAHQWSDLQACEIQPELCQWHNLDVVKLLCEYARQRQIPLLQLSSCQVFDGTKKNPYKSANTGNPLNGYGEAKWQAEQWVREHVDKHLVLRVGWLFDLHPDAVLDQVLNAYAQRKPVFFSDQHRGNPTAPEDVARVVIAIVKQLLCDVPVWGTYQYASAEIVSQLTFARSVAALWLPESQVGALIQPLTSEHPKKVPEPCNAALGCIKIRNTFGIKQQPWRKYLQSVVQRRYKAQADSKPADVSPESLSASN